MYNSSFCVCKPFMHQKLKYGNPCIMQLWNKALKILSTKLKPQFTKYATVTLFTTISSGKSSFFMPLQGEVLFFKFFWSYLFHTNLFFKRHSFAILVDMQLVYNAPFWGIKLEGWCILWLLLHLTSKQTSSFSYFTAQMSSTPHICTNQSMSKFKAVLVTMKLPFQSLTAIFLKWNASFILPIL